MRKLLATLLLLLGCTAGIQAQVLLRYGADIDNGWGDAGMVATAYVQFPSAVTTAYQGNHITRVRIGLNGPATNVYLYFKTDTHDSQNLYRQKLDNLEAGWNEIELETPFAIDGQPLAIGYKGSFASARGIGYSNEKYSDGDIVYYNSKNRWTSTGGSICIQALVEGDNMPQNELQMGRMGNQTAPYEATEMTFTGTVRNVGGNDITSYTLRYTVNDTDEQTLPIDHAVAVNATDTFSITLPSTVPGVYNLRVWIDQVNGQTDGYSANNEVSATLTVKDPAFMRRVVCEEYTGLWCGWCPRGMVGLDLMMEQHPDHFIPISVHGGDVLEIDGSLDYSYQPFISSMTGAPSCKVDRKLSGDPFYDIQNLYNMETGSDATATIEATATWNADSTAITMHAEYYTAADQTNAAFNIAYVLTEDSVTGYNQTNYYANGRNGDFYGWEGKSDPTSDCYFNYLARGIYGNFTGEEAHTGAVTAYEPLTHDYTFEVPATVADKRQLHVATLLLDRNSGFIVNAARTAPTGQESGIDERPFQPSAVSGQAVYNLQGQRVMPGTRGIHIININGQYRKVLVK